MRAKPAGNLTCFPAGKSAHNAFTRLYGFRRDHDPSPNVCFGRVRMASCPPASSRFLESCACWSAWNESCRLNANSGWTANCATRSLAQSGSGLRCRGLLPGGISALATRRFCGRLSSHCPSESYRSSGLGACCATRNWFDEMRCAAVSPALRFPRYQLLRPYRNRHRTLMLTASCSTETASTHANQNCETSALHCGRFLPRFRGSQVY